MKVINETEELFKPVTIVLQSKEELAYLWHALNIMGIDSLRKNHCTDSLTISGEAAREVVGCTMFNIIDGVAQERELQ